MSENDMKKLVADMEQHLRIIAQSERPFIEKVDCIWDISKRYRSTIFTLHSAEIINIKQFVYLRNRVGSMRRKYANMVA